MNKLIPKPNESNVNNSSRVTILLPTANESKKKFEIKRIGIMTDIYFCISDAEGDTTGMAFRMAYKVAKIAKTNKELCGYVGSMLCSVVPGFRNSVLTSLNAISVRPRFVSLPSEANAYYIFESALPQLDWSSILVIFGYCCLLLFKLDFDHSIGYVKYMSNCIRDLQAEVIWDPSKTLDIQFDASKASSISVMLGSRDLRENVITFLTDNSNHPDSQVSKVCKYLKTILSAVNLD